MYVPCWSCGHDIWIENQTECRHCGAVAKRCVDCESYQRTTRLCEMRGVEVSEEEAAKPHTLSSSYRCETYQQSQAAAAHARLRRETGPPKAAAAAPAATAPPAEAPAEKRKRPHVIAHRGWSAAAPENTLAAIREAARIKSDGIEIDVHVTADGMPVVIHDATLERTTSGTGAVARTKFVDLRELDAGSWFDSKFSNERVPTLVDAIRMAPPPCFLNVHVKCHENESDRAEKAIVAALQAGGATGRCWITHHTRHGLHRFRELDANLRLCWLPQGGGEELEYIDEAYYMGYRIIQPTFRAVTPEFVEYAHKRKMWINVFWADEPEAMRQLTEWGVDGILTNHPEVLQEVLGLRRAASSSG